MSVKMTGQYLGNKKVEMVHEPSGARILTDAPKDNQGEGSQFSPTDLVGASLASCILTTIAIVAERDGIELKGSHFSVEKDMTSEPPRKIAQLTVVLHLPAEIAQEAREKLERVAKTCPVHRSLSEEIKMPIAFFYDV